MGRSYGIDVHQDRHIVSTAETDLTSSTKITAKVTLGTIKHCLLASGQWAHVAVAMFPRMPQHHHAHP